jgi:hypothetical protein
MHIRNLRRIAALALACAAGGAQAGGAAITVGDLVWNDVDADGVRDGNEPGMGGVVVQLWNDARNMLLDQTTTSAAGIYTLEAPGAGNYRMRVVLPLISDGFSPKDAVADDLVDSDINPSGVAIGFTDTITLLGGTIGITNIDAGIVRAPIALGNRVWNDIDADGIQDFAEPGIAGIVVQLWNDAKTLNLRSIATDAAGAYQLLAPGPGSYRIRVIKAGADTFSPKDAGASDALDSDVNPAGVDASFTDVLVVSVASNDIDGGIVRAPIAVGNFVWNDLDRNGVQNGGEPGLGSVSVQLWNADRNQVLDSTTTSASGFYTLQAPGPGDYRVRVVLPTAQDAFSPKDTPPSDLLDSDINPTGVLTGFTDIYTFGSGVISTTNIDGGIIATTLFADGFE